MQNQDEVHPYNGAPQESISGRTDCDRYPLDQKLLKSIHILSFPLLHRYFNNNKTIKISHKFCDEKSWRQPNHLNGKCMFLCPLNLLKCPQSRNVETSA